jgi:hypothetical protein
MMCLCLRLTVIGPDLCIQPYNSCLNRTVKLFRHVAIVEFDSNRKYFIRRGLHLNNARKEWLSKQIAIQIDKLIKNNNRDEPKVVLKLKVNQIEQDHKG